MNKAIPISVNAKITWVKIVRNWQLYVMIAPAVILIFIFSYIPMAGAQIAFRDYNVVGGIWGSPWVGLKHFEWFLEKWVSQETRMQARKYSLAEWQALGFDQHSVFADPLFVDPENGDYRVRPESPALKLGFKNFDMDKFGLNPDFPDQWKD